MGPFAGATEFCCRSCAPHSLPCRPFVSPTPTPAERRSLGDHAMRPAFTFLTSTLLVASAVSLPAQANRNALQPPASASVASATNDNTKRAMTVADYARWRTIRDVAISDDGVWASYGYQQRRVDDTLFVKNLVVGTEQKIPR